MTTLFVASYEQVNMRVVVPVSESCELPNRASPLSDNDAAVVSATGRPETVPGCVLPDLIHIEVSSSPYLPIDNISHINAPGTIPEEYWEQMKPVIRRTYLDEEKSLNQVMDIMKLVYGFKARQVSYLVNHAR
jgi:hypothetical protein